ncbi:nitrate- and nitrite sensing domain-containing protein [Nonomuraea sp. NPDC050328]|uniref:nitrate- and nitrite sensing domain-containing protein n=1 Tax=Nonomuraea sp. NPDC050328 TaxID=3364361 RepID=UPI0037BD3D37
MASGRSIRFKITVLLVLPLVSLVVLWIFAASATTGEALNLLRVESVWRGLIDPSDGLVSALQKERLASAERKNLPARRAETEKARATLSRSVKELDDLRPETRERLADVFTALDRLPEIRQGVDERTLDPADMVAQYATVSDAVHTLYSTVALSTDLELYRRANAVIATDQVRELLSREHALVVAAGARLSDADRRALAKLDGSRTWLQRRAFGDLDEALRLPYDKVDFGPFDRAVTTLLEEQALTADTWRRIADPLVEDYTKAVWASSDVLLSRMEPAGRLIIVRAGLAGVLGLIAVLASLFLALRMGRRLTRELAGLRAAAIELASVRLPQLVARLKKGEQAEILPVSIPTGGTTEIADVAAAFESVQNTAVDAAVGQAELREGIAEALRNLARRTQGLVQRQLKLLEDMQGQTEDPDALSRLFKLDHLTTRMRRHAEGLVLLSGGSGGRVWRRTVAVEEVLTGAAAQVEEYTRVRIYPMPEIGVVGAAVADLMHLFAELVENATTFSANEVSVRGECVGRGFVIEVEDRGFGMSPEEREEVNARFAGPADFDPANSERLGFAVVAMLAARHRVQVTLKASPYGGTTAIVLLPSELVEPMAPPPEPDGDLLPRRTRKAGLESVPAVRDTAPETPAVPAVSAVPLGLASVPDVPAPNLTPAPNLAPNLTPVPDGAPAPDLPRRVRPGRLQQGRIEEKA